MLQTRAYRGTTTAGLGRALRLNLELRDKICAFSSNLYSGESNKQLERPAHYRLLRPCTALFRSSLMATSWSCVERVSFQTDHHHRRRRDV